MKPHRFKEKHIQNRGAITQTSLILLLAIIIIISTTVLIFSINITSSTFLSNKPAPQFTADIIEIESGTGLERQRITIIHMQGEPINVSNLEIEIQLTNYSLSTRVKNLPTNSLSMNENLEGDNFLDRGVGGISGVTRTGGEWEVGEAMGFRVRSSAVNLKKNDEVKIEIIHLPTESIIYTGHQPVS